MTLKYILKIAAKFAVKSFEYVDDAAEFMGLDLHDIDEGDLIKRYRELAKKYHPDVNKSEEAEGQFKTLQNAYNLLKDFFNDDLYDDPYASVETPEERACREREFEEEERADAEFRETQQPTLDKLNYSDLLIYIAKSESPSWQLISYSYERAEKATDADLVNALIALDKFYNETRELKDQKLSFKIYNELKGLKDTIANRMVSANEVNGKYKFVYNFNVEQLKRLPEQYRKELIIAAQKRRNGIMEVLADDGIMIE